jgi:hypothetical protein
MTDEELLAGFEAGTLSNASFRHLDHLHGRLALSARLRPWVGEERMGAGFEGGPSSSADAGHARRHPVGFCIGSLTWGA